jgi:hypothetical protein
MLAAICLASPMHETEADLRELQALLDRSYESAGTHLRRIITPERRLSAEALAGRLQGMCLLALATVTADGRPIVGPVTVHGRAVPVEVRGETGAGLRQALLDIYVPRYGPGWERFLDSGPVYARIDAERMFTLHADDAD